MGRKDHLLLVLMNMVDGLSDEINIDTIEGMKLYIVDPKEHGEFYFALRAIEFPYKMSTEPIWTTEDLPF